MAVRVRFCCAYCDALPDADTQRTLQGHLRDRRLGEYLDAQPGGWLIWTAGGALGCKRYACPRHRADLIDHVRAHYGATCSGASQPEPYPALWPDGFSALDECELAELLELTATFDPERRAVSQATDSPAAGSPDTTVDR